MDIKILDNKKLLGTEAAARAAGLIRGGINARGNARIIVATGASQFEFLEALTSTPEIDWARVTMFHLDEYIGLPQEHPASFRKYLRERLIDKVGIGVCHLLDPGTDPRAECRRMGKLIQEAPIDVAFVGIGENGHLAFNDPPADFETEEPYLVVNLDRQCRMQQLGEGWFKSFEEIPVQAISMSIRQILKSRAILCMVPDLRKAKAVRATLTEPVSPAVPASIMRTHPDTTLYLDRDSASLVENSASSQV
jgi:glucosamine-6-phosphate deaminase